MHVTIGLYALAQRIHARRRAVAQRGRTIPLNAMSHVVKHEETHALTSDPLGKTTASTNTRGEEHDGTKKSTSKKRVAERPRLRQQCAQLAAHRATFRTRLTLRPGRPGTRRLVARYGTRLVRVRYRYDDQHRIRITTVELIVAVRALPPR